MPERGPGEIHYGNPLPNMEKNRDFAVRHREIIALAEESLTEDSFGKAEPKLLAAKQYLTGWIADVELRVKNNPMAISSEANGYAATLKKIENKLQQINDVRRARKIQRESNPGLIKRAVALVRKSFERK